MLVDRHAMWWAHHNRLIAAIKNLMCTNCVTDSCVEIKPPFLSLHGLALGSFTLEFTEEPLLQPTCLTWSMTITLDVVWDLLINCYLLHQARHLHCRPKLFVSALSGRWNSLPHLTRSCKLFSTFAQTLKTELSDTAYSEHSTYSRCHLMPLIRSWHMRCCIKCVLIDWMLLQTD